MSHATKSSCYAFQYVRFRVACRSGNLKAAQKFASDLPSVDYRSFLGRPTALMYALKGGHKPVLNWLIKQGAVLPDTYMGQPIQVILMTYYYSLKGVRYLSNEMNMPFVDRKYHLKIAAHHIKAGCVKALNELEKLGLKIDFKGYASDFMLDAVLSGSLEMVKHIKSKCSPDIDKSYNFIFISDTITVVEAAYVFRHPKIYQYLNSHKWGYRFRYWTRFLR